MKRVPIWIRNALGLATEIVPARLRSPDVLPVMEIYRGEFAERVARVDGVAGVVPQQIVNTTAEEWELLSLVFIMTADANVANREANVTITDPSGSGTILYFMRSNFNHAAGITATYIFAAHGVIGQTGTQGNAIAMPCPPNLRIPPGFRIDVSFTNFQAGDQITNFGIYVKRWPYAVRLP